MIFNTVRGLIEQNNPAAIEYLLVRDRFQTEMTDETGRTALMFAAQKGNRQMVQFLLEKEANPNACDDKGRSVLIFAIKSKDVDTIKMIIEAGADVWHQQKGYSILTAAAHELRRAKTKEEIKKATEVQAFIHTYLNELDSVRFNKEMAFMRRVPSARSY